MILGITGSFGSGKTTVAHLFKRYGYTVINVDKFYHGLLKKGTPLHKKVKAGFGTTDRKKLKKIVFSDYKKLKKLNKLTHPYIIQRLKTGLKGRKNIVIDAPLLIEAKALSLVDKLIVVKAKKSVQIKRLMAKGYAKRGINQITSSQLPLETKIRYADFVIDNSGSLKSTKKQVIHLIKALERR